MRVSTFSFLFGLLFTASVISAAPDDALFTDILMDHVDEGAVDYRSIADDERLDTYLVTRSSPSGSTPTTPTP